MAVVTFRLADFSRTHQTRSQVPGMQDERALRLPGESNYSVPGKVASIASTKVHVGNRNKNGGDERGGRPRR